jgi:hypothetical protein
VPSVAYAASARGAQPVATCARTVSLIASDPADIGISGEEAVPLRSEVTLGKHWVVKLENAPVTPEVASRGARRS